MVGERYTHCNPPVFLSGGFFFPAVGLSGWRISLIITDENRQAPAA